jgi:hypothetical protein
MAADNFTNGPFIPRLQWRYVEATKELPIDSIDSINFGIVVVKFFYGGGDPGPTAAPGSEKAVRDAASSMAVSCNATTRTGMRSVLLYCSAADRLPASVRGLFTQFTTTSRHNATISAREFFLWRAQRETK